MVIKMRKKETQISTIIGAGAECGGDFKAEGSIRVDGTVNGNVIVTEAVIVGATGCINGNIDAKSVIIGGEIYGNLNVPEKVELTSTARVIGDITTNGLVIDEKAIFQGRCDMNQDASKRSRPDRRALKDAKKEARADMEDVLKEAGAAFGEETES